ncbi:MAG: ATP-binding protein [Planctomycetes bacterium]|nr:ATP-binding protein [Planctomycetota bacterium]
MPDENAGAPEKDATLIDAQGHGWAELIAPNRPASFDEIERIFESGAFASLAGQERDDLKFALREICQNAFEWGNQKEPQRYIRVSYCLFADKIVLKISDEGEGFDPARVPDPKKDLRNVVLARKKAGKRPGGFGIYLVKKIMDEVVYNEKGNVVLLTKHLSRNRTPS